MVPAAPPPVPAVGATPPRARRRWAVPLAIIGLAPMVAVVISTFVPASAFVNKRSCVAVDQDNVCTERGPQEAVRFAVVPADASPAGSRLSVQGLHEFDDTRNILFVTVREPELQLFEWFVARHDPGTSGLFSYQDLYSNVTPTQDRQNAFRDMRNAKNDAYYVALKKLGYPVEVLPGPAVVEQLICFEASGGVCTKRAPAADVLEPNDRLTSIDGKPITMLDDLTPLISVHRAGDTVTVGYERGKAKETAKVQLVAAPDDGRPLIGVQMADTRTIKIPSDIKVDFQTEDIGGPSAGLSFTLTLIDRLSAGDLTGGKKVAVTGTIDVDGNVGPIGGLQSKASAVRQEGVRYFIVPFEQGPADIAAAQKSAGSGVEIIPVKTLDEALAAMQRIGGERFVPPPAAAGQPSAPTQDVPTTTSG